MASIPDIFWPLPWWTPNAPDLGCFVRNEHPFELDANFFFWAEFSPWQIVNDRLIHIPHQVYARIKCGRAAFHQRVRAWMTPPSTNPLSLLGAPPDHVLGGDHPPRPGDWVKFPVQQGEKLYWFAGEHRPPTDAVWRGDAAVGHSFDRYDNGTLSTVGWDDTGGDRDFDDAVMEVAVVYRWPYFETLEVARVGDDLATRWEREEWPKLLASAKAAPREGYKSE